MNSQILRPYQTSALEALRAAHRAGKRRLLLVAPTGSGKTTIAAHVIKTTVDRGYTAAFIAHRRELIDQASHRLANEGIRHRVVMANDYRSRIEAPVSVCSIDTLRSRAKRDGFHLPPADVLITDEAHRSQAASYRWLLGEYPDSTIIGLTATPIRLDGKGLGDIYDHMEVVAHPKDLIGEGFLVRPRLFAPYVPDLDRVRTARGDFHSKELAAEMDRPQLVANIVDTWRENTPGHRTVIFAVGIEHSQHIRDAFRAAGVAAEHIDGKTPNDLRAGALARLRSGETTVLCNVGILTEGWDLPALEVVLLARPTQSLALYLQMVGRVMRPWPDKRTAVVLDHAGNCLRHGPPAQYREWILRATPKRKREQIDPISMRTCPQCYACLPSTLGKCPECGYVFTISEREIRQVEGKLTEVDEDGDTACACGSVARIRQRNAEWWGEFTVLVRCGSCGRPLDWRTEQPAKAAPGAKEQEYGRLMDVARAKGLKPGWAAHRYKDVFGVWPRNVATAAHKEAISRDKEGLSPWDN